MSLSNSHLLGIMLGACVIVGLFAAAYYALLMFSHPGRTRWLQARWMDNAVLMAIISLGVIDVGLELTTLVGDGVDPLLALAVEFAFTLATGVALWKVLHVRERLDAARHGVSPFLQLRHIRHHLRERCDDPDAGSGATGKA